MLLAIDAGNTNIVFALYEGNEQRQCWRIRTERGRTADEYTAWLYPLFMAAGFQFDQVDDAIISSVIPDENRNLRELCDRTFSCTPVVIGSDMIDLRIDVNLLNPEQLGADRLMNAAAINAFYEAPAIVIDFGTATNFDVIDVDGAHCGGILAPGVNLSMDALHRAAAKLPKVSIKNPGAVIGTDTVSAMQSGLYWGYISMIEGLVARIGNELGEEPFVLATGGLAPIFAGGTDVIQHVDPDLTLKGLVHIYHTRVAR